MKERTARKIMKNVRLYQGMIWIYGSHRVDKANNICIRRYSRVSQGIKRWNALTAKNPLLVLEVFKKMITNYECKI